MIFLEELHVKNSRDQIILVLRITVFKYLDETKQVTLEAL